MKPNFLKSLIFASLLVISCNNDKGSDVKIPTATEFSTIRQEALNNVSKSFKLKLVNGDTTFVSNKGVEIYIDPSCITKNGNAVTGELDVKFTELFDAGSMLVTNKTTMGQIPDTDNLGLLISGGEFNITVSQGGVACDLNCNVRLKIPGALTGGADNQMILFDGTIDEDGNVEWKEQNRKAEGQGGVFAEGNQYYAFANNFGWTNVDKFYSDPRPKTTILASVPEGFDQSNCDIYLHYKGEPNALAKLDTYDSATKLFSEHYGQIPIGLECQIIFVTEESGQWRYAIKNATITANAVYNFTLGETAVVSESQLITIINSLP